MHRYENATIDTDRETAKLYEWALGEHDADGNPTNPIKFPLSRAQVTHNGSRAVVSIPRAGKANFILDRLIHSPEPKETRKGESGTVNISGESERLYRQNVAPADAAVHFTILEYSASLVSGMTG
jgi:hypothetical protein